MNVIYRQLHCLHIRRIYCPLYDFCSGDDRNSKQWEFCRAKLVELFEQGPADE
jgi:hypothetical protein